MNGGDQMIDTNKHSHETPVDANDYRRRRFLGKGIKAAPFVLTLASQPALGVTCFTPSRSLSKNTSISQQGKNGECTNAESAENYKMHQDPSASAFHWPRTVPPSTPFHPLFRQGSSSANSFTVPLSGGGFRSMTLGEVLTHGVSQDSDEVAKHLIGAYLNTMGGNAAFIPANVMTPQGILGIWSEYVANSGFYEPVAGVKWYANEIKYYLTSNGIVK